MARRDRSKSGEQRISMIGIHVTATEYAYLRRLAKLRGESISTMGRQFLLDHVRQLGDMGQLIPGEVSHANGSD
jgi:hypothetical protein